MPDRLHQPVLAEAVLAYLSPRAGESYLDLTAGYGGHAAQILQVTGAPKKAVLIDRDGAAVGYLKEHLKGPTVVQQAFWQAASGLLQAGQRFDMILADLGASSAQLDAPGRGFSFRSQGPLDMRFDTRQALTASQIVNDWSADKLADLLAEQGEEPKARAIARAIVGLRPVRTTTELAAIVARFWPRGKKHPATRTFQALRMAVNAEQQQLTETLPLLPDLLKAGGRLVIISFHSLEDRLAKQFLAEASYGYEAQLHLLTKKPVQASAAEIAINPRARSAKLRAAAKIKTKERKS